MDRSQPFTQTPQPQPSPTGNALNPSSFAGIITVLQQLVIGQSALTTAINNKFPNWVAVPTATTDPGSPGQVAFDGTYFYCCVATDTWGRVLLDFAF